MIGVDVVSRDLDINIYNWE